MANFPTSLPSFAGFTSTHTLAADNHAAQHNLEQGEVVAVATKIGTGSSTPTSGLLLRGTGAGTSSWSQAVLTSDVSGVLPQANGGTGTTLATGTGKAVYDTSPTISGAQLTSSPTLTTPTIADFTNATHTHASNAQGGQLNGANAIQAGTLTSSQVNTTIAQILAGGNYKIQSGTVAVNASPDVTVTFSSTFAATPLVIAATSSAGSANVWTSVNSITTTSFKIRQFNTAGSQTTSESASWIAIGT